MVARASEIRLERQDSARDRKDERTDRDMREDLPEGDQRVADRTDERQLEPLRLALTGEGSRRGREKRNDQKREHAAEGIMDVKLARALRRAVPLEDER